MENYSYTSYAESGESSPRSRDADFDNPQPWDDQSAATNHNNYKVKFMCSYGGKIHPRPHDNQLSYVGGQTKILAVDRFVKFASVISKLTALCDGDVCVKYQLPGEDLDALISVTNDDDLEHMMHEYDRLNRTSPTPARLRLFLFPVTAQSPAMTPVHSFGSTEGRSDRDRFMDALNSSHHQSTTPPTSHGNSDLVMPPQQSEVTSRGRDHEIEADRLQKHIQDLQRMRIVDQEQQPNTLYRKPGDDKMTDKVDPATGYHISGGYTGTTISPDQQGVYMIQAPTSMYHAPMARAVTPPVNHGGQGYYVQRMPTDHVYNMMAQSQSVATQQTTVSQSQQQFVPQNMATYTEGYRMVQSTTAVTDPAAGYGQVTYDNATGRQIYYTTQGAVLAQPQQLQPSAAQQYHPMAAAATVNLNQENANMKEFI